MGSNLRQSNNLKHRSTKGGSDAPLSQRLPANSWDSHIHVVEEPSRYPLSTTANYQPSKPHTLSDALAFTRTTGIHNVVLIQPSIYGYDNSCLLDSLRQLGPRRARGVVCFDAATIDEEPGHRGSDSVLSTWHQLGVRGVRLNLVSVPQELDAGELARMLHEYADLIRDYGWVLELYIRMETMPDLATIVPSLGVKVCLDHIANPKLPPRSSSPSSPSSSPLNPYDLVGFPALISLLEKGSTYVKISGPYRLSADPQFHDVGAMVRELMRAGRERLVFATDWPHTRFEGVDIAPFTEACLGWCAEAGPDMAERLFRRNAEELWDVTAPSVQSMCSGDALTARADRYELR
ncbi:conserved hypothetical protein [Histoplasma mississippiense (nom. inval.)]|nr:conserved hypothetical protein [Histoplasma mississippiense (nom. inval.)]EDN05610.1 conserved hypothetical protein [Histoplasma mississippiense (nom. inval.)]